MDSTNNKKIRNAKLTKQKILDAARIEFSTKGVGGGRVDNIAALANINKRMIYYYFNDKSNLFYEVMINNYNSIRDAEEKLCLKELNPKEALEKLIRFTWDYYRENPDFIVLINNENLHKAKNIKKSDELKNSHNNSIKLLKDILKRGAQEGYFKENINARQLHITIASVNYYYFTNKYTLSHLLDTDLTSEQELKERIDFNIESILSIVSK